MSTVVPGFTINYTYGSSITALQTSDPTEYNEVTGAIQLAIAAYQQLITTPITVNITFGWGVVNATPIATGAAGQSITEQYAETYSAVQSALLKTDTTSAVQLAAAASLPLNDPTNGATFDVASAEAKALGLQASTATDGYVGLDSSLNWNFTQSNIGSTQYDAVGTIEHEISEVLGRSDTGGANGTYTPLDLFRYTAADGQPGDAPGAAAGARDEPFVTGYNANAYSYFSYNGTTVTQQYDLPANVARGADIADWAQTVPEDSYGYANEGSPGLITTTDLQELNVLGYDMACYVAGTRIATPRGEVAVEVLRIGDDLLTASGAARPLRWIGRRSYARRFAGPGAVPILIRANALADGVPARDLRVSPNHAMYLDDLLIPAENLVNGGTIVPCDATDDIVYFHLELASHDIIIAEGAASESFVDDDSRMLFHNAQEYARLYPHAEAQPAIYCAPRVTGGYALHAIRNRLARRAGLLAATPPAPLRGYLDLVRPNLTKGSLTEGWLVEGWAQNPSQPEVPICLDIEVDGVVVARTLANHPRPDLARAGLGSGRHAFAVHLPEPLTPAQRQTITVRRSSDQAPLTRTARA